MTYYLWAILANVKRCWVADPSKVTLEGSDLFPEHPSEADPAEGVSKEADPQPVPTRPSPQEEAESRRLAREELERNQLHLARGGWLAAVGGVHQVTHVREGGGG